MLLALLFACSMPCYLCEAVTCGIPSAPEWSFTKDTPLFPAINVTGESPGDQATATCHNGTFLDSSTPNLHRSIRCKEDGTWEKWSQSQCKLQNLARGKPAYQSSVSNNNLDRLMGSHTPDKLVDGKFNTYAKTDHAYSYPWMVVDLEMVFDQWDWLTVTVRRWSTVSSNTARVDIRIMLSYRENQDPMKFSPVLCKIFEYGISNTQKMRLDTMECNDEKFRFFVIQGHGDTVLVINEIQVHGKKCLPGFANVDKYCKECSTFEKPCQNGANCIIYKNNFICNCSTAYTGALCETPISECGDGSCDSPTTSSTTINAIPTKSPTKISASPTISSTKISASPTMSSTKISASPTTSSTTISACISSPCQNSGTCKVTDSGYSCQCPAGSTGKSCESNFDECESDPCKNNGTCVNKNGTYSCHCHGKFTGHFCETVVVDVCDSDPCLNNGTCTSTESEFVCHCLEGYTDTLCTTETKVDRRAQTKMLALTIPLILASVLLLAIGIILFTRRSKQPENDDSTEFTEASDDDNEVEEGD